MSEPYEELTSGRYGFLLQPIKDLQKNWDIDIAALLDEFCTKLRESRETVGDGQNGGSTKFNFAEAAMLIQGSTMIYGKKVEYLHDLAMNFNELLRNKKAKKNFTAGDGQEGAEEDDDPVEAAADLDDPCELIDFKNLRCNNWRTLLLKGNPKPPPLLHVIPISLMPLADFEKTNIPLYSSRNSNEIIGKKDDFIINTGFIHGSGALLLDLANERLLNDFVEIDEHVGDLSTAIENSIDGSMHQIAAQNAFESCDVIEKNRRGTSMINMPSTHRDTSHANLVDDITKNCVNDLRDDFVQVSQDDDIMEVDCEGGGFDDSTCKDDDNANRENKHPADESGFESDDDVNFLADPFFPQKYKNRPYKSCIPYVMPNEREKRKKRKLEKLGIPAEFSVQNFFEQYVYRSVPPGSVPNHPSDHCQLFTSVLGKYVKKMEKERMKKLTLKKRSRKRVAFQGNHEASDGESSDDSFVNQMDASDDQDEHEEIQNRASPIADLTFGAVHEDDLQCHMNVSSVFADAESANSRPLDEMTAEQILKFYLQKYWTATEESTSLLRERVQNWEERIQPLLDEEAERTEFNINDYSDRLIDRLGEIGATKTFRDLLGVDEKSYETSRYFLSTLMLANAGNLEIIQMIDNNEKNRESEVCNKNRQFQFQVKLLKRDRHHEVFTNATSF